jgi:hypothetical protein
MSYGTVQAEKMTTESGYSLGAGNASSFKNRIINGAMVIDQRNAGASVSITGDSSIYTVDRWTGFKGGSTNNFTVQQNTTVPTGNFTNSVVITTGTGTATGAGDYAGFQQKIEGFNFADIGWGTANAQSVTFSFWVRSSVTGTFGAIFRNAAANTTYCGTYTISSANTWTFASITVPGYTSGTWNTGNGIGVTVSFDLGVGSDYSGTANQWNTGANYFGVTGTTKLTQTTGATWYLTGVQLEVGTVATSFDYRPYGTELALCQRYYERVFVGGNTMLGMYSTAGSGSFIGAGLKFAVSKRATPTMPTVTSGVAAWVQPGVALYSAQTTLSFIPLAPSIDWFGYSQARSAGFSTPTATNAYMFEGEVTFIASAEL